MRSSADVIGLVSHGDRRFRCDVLCFAHSAVADDPEQEGSSNA